MGLWHSNNVKAILLKFAKDHCFWTLWTLNYVDCIPFSCFLVLILSILLTIKPNNLRKFYSQIFKKHNQTFIFAEGVRQNQPCSSAHLFVCPPIFDAFLSGSTQWIFLIVCMKLFCHIYLKITKPDFGKLYFLCKEFFV